MFIGGHFGGGDEELQRGIACGERGWFAFGRAGVDVKGGGSGCNEKECHKDVTRPSRRLDSH